MAYNETLASRIREVLPADGIEEKKMFGGIAYMLGGNMVCGVTKDDLIVRVGPDNHDMALDRTGARPMDFSGRPSRGMVFVGPAGYQTDDGLKDWLDLAMSFSVTLPPKPTKTSGARRKAKS